MSLGIYNVFSKVLVLFGVMFYLLSVLTVYLEKTFFFEWSIYSLSGVSMSMGVLFDWMSGSFLSVVCFISGSILMYCNYYMEGEKNYLRFSFVLLLFVSSMWFLIISPNMVSILLGWDGLGLTSYALVIFYQNESSCNAGMLTVLSNRVGDVAILMVIGIMSAKGSWNFIFWEESDLLVVCLVSLAAMTKSAQMPFSAWLPAAMAAPTPVSSLVHSSTLVTAGVYLLVRFNNFLMMSGISEYLLWVGVMTMVMSGLGANFEGDMKKIIALSTLSQLGLMIMILSLGLPELAYFHLVTHALFKSSLFMCAGFMIHSVKGSQDSRCMSGFGGASPVLGLALSVTNFALCGFPFLAGFYSKDLILESMFMGSGNMLLLIFVVFGTGLTVSYSIRLIFNGVSNSSMLSSVSNLGDVSGVLGKSLSFLLSLSILGGFTVGWVYYPFLEVVVLGGGQKYWVLSVILVSGVMMFFLLDVYERKLSLGGESEGRINYFLSLMWFAPKLSGNSSMTSFLLSGSNSSKMLDSGWLEYYGGKGTGSFLMNLSLGLQKGQTSVMISGYLVSGVLVIIILMI